MRAFLAALALFGVYAGLSLLNDPLGSLGADTGAKVATVRMMDRNGTWRPDVGYWAAEWDPAGELHPLYQTHRHGDEWVAVTTLPFLLVGRPLYALGGERLLLLLPMVGSVAAALAARALAGRFGADARTGWLAFWLVGLGTPLAIYALDFWEHSTGVALGAWALVLLVDALQRGAAVVRVASAAFLFGVAATMRTDALVYGAVAVGATVVILAWRRAWSPAAMGAVAGLVAVAIPLVANAGLERALVTGDVRVERATGTATAAGGELGDRAEEAAATSVGLNLADAPVDYLLGLAVAGLVAFGAVVALRGDDGVALLAFGAAAGVIAIRAVSDLGFVPGLLTASPLAAAGVVVGWRSVPWRPAGVVALLAVPLVWAFQYQGGALPQWGGRYLLLTGFVLAVGTVLQMGQMPRRPAVALGVLALLVTSTGLAWLSVRSHGFADAGGRVAGVDADVVIARPAYLLRELGARYDERRSWLTAAHRDDLATAAAVAAEAGADRIALLTLDEPVPSELGRYSRLSEDTVDVVPDVELHVTMYERS